MWIATEINLHHPDTIKEAFNRLLAAKRRRILWDLNPSPPNHPIYTEYIDTFAEKFAGRYNYEKFRIWDNATLSPERLEEIEGEYTPGTFWYRRDIQGERCAAEGVIYETLANNPGGVVIYEAPSIMYATIGVDFGGNGSATAFNLTGYTRGLRQVVTLAEWRKQGVITPADVEENFIRFVQAAQRQYIVTDAYCDSAEQTLIRGLVVACARARIGISIHNARKGPIIDRIRFFCKLHDQGRHKIMHTCTNTLEAFRNAVWDGKPIGELIRLDNGRYDIDSLDAQEYAVEPLMRQIIEVSNV